MPKNIRNTRTLKYVVIGLLLAVLITGTGCSIVIGGPGETAQPAPAADVNIAPTLPPAPGVEISPAAVQATPAAMTEPLTTTAQLTATVAPPSPTIDPINPPPVGIPTSTPGVIATPAPLAYIVQPGDTLGKIISRLGTACTYNIIAAYNQLPNPNIIEVGRVLLIPPCGPNYNSNGAIPAGMIVVTATPTIIVVSIPPTPLPGYPTSTSYPTNTPDPTSTPVTVTFVGTIDDNTGCSVTNWTLIASGVQYYLLMSDDFEAGFDPDVETRQAQITGTKDDQCSGSLIVVESLNWLVTPTPTASATVNSGATATAAVTISTATAAAKTATAVFQPTATEQAKQTATVQANQTATAAASITPTATATATPTASPTLLPK